MVDKGDTIKTDLLARLDRIPWNSGHSYVFAILFGGVILEGFSISLGGATLGSLEKAFDLTAFEAILLTPIYLLGALVGSFVMGSLSDIAGRKKIFIVTVIIVIIGSIIVAVSFNYGSLILGRIVTAIGAEGEVAVANTALSEFVEPKRRGFVVASGNATAFDVGTFAASLVGFYAITLLPADIGWRVAFSSAIILGLIVFFARLKLPESVRYLVRNKRFKEAEKIVSGIEAGYEKSTGKKLPPVTPEILAFSTQSAAQKYGYVFKKYPKQIGLAVTLNLTEVWPYYAAFSVIPAILIKFFKFSSSESSLSLIYITLAGVAGIIVMSLALDRIGRRKTITISYGIAALMWLITGLVSSVVSIAFFIVLLVILYFWVYAAAGVLYPQISEMFPTSVRNTAVGTAIGIGRIGGIIGIVVLAAILNEGVLVVFAITAAVMAVGAIAEFLVGPETSHKPLEVTSMEETSK